MSDLETKIRELAARGEVTHLSLVPSADGKHWHASYAPASVFGITHGDDADPIKAILMALNAPRLKSRRPKPDADLLAVTADDDDDDLGLGD